MPRKPQSGLLGRAGCVALSAALAACGGDAPTEIGPPGPWLAVSVGGSASCGTTAEGRSFCWGGNFSGGLGDSTTTPRLTPTPLAGGVEFERLSVGSAHTCGITPDGRAFCWGSNEFGQLGDGTTTNRLVPTPVSGDLLFRRISAGSGFTCGVTRKGRAFCWGWNAEGQLGDGSKMDRTAPTPVAGGLTFELVDAGGDHACGISPAGRAFCWGDNLGGEIGDGTDLNERSEPTPVAGDLVFTQISAGGVAHTCGVTVDHSAFCWGSGPLGVGSGSDFSTPTRVAGGHAFVRVSAGRDHTCGIAENGRALCWGSDLFGRLGDGKEEGRRREPTPVAGGLTFARISAARFHTCGVTFGRRACCWGRNSFGQLGDGTRTNRGAPTPVRPPTTP